MNPFHSHEYERDNADIETRIKRLEGKVTKLEGKATLADDLADSVKPTGIDLINASMKRP